MGINSRLLMNNPTEHQLRSYFAGMLDHKGVFSIHRRGRVKKLIIQMKTKSAKQAVALQQWIGGNIQPFKSYLPKTKTPHSTYVIRYYNLMAAKLIELLGPFIVAQNKRLEEACAFRQLPLPSPQEPDMNFYIGGAIDAKESFQNTPFRGKPYPRFGFTTYHEREAEFLGVQQYANRNGQYSQCRYNVAKNLLERFKPYILEYDKYHASLHLGIIMPIDLSIISPKTIPKTTSNRPSHEQISDRLRHRLREVVGSKSESHLLLIGCSPMYLTRHIESQFEPWMSWENVDQWDVDHIIPCRAFDLTIKEQRLKCFHYTNLRPLSKSANIAKSDKLPNGGFARDIFQFD